jgi:hypothetical protein
MEIGTQFANRVMAMAVNLSRSAISLLQPHFGQFADGYLSSGR